MTEPIYWHQKWWCYNTKEWTEVRFSMSFVESDEEYVVKRVCNKCSEHFFDELDKHEQFYLHKNEDQDDFRPGGFRNER